MPVTGSMVANRRPEAPPPVFRIPYKSPLLGSVDRLLKPLTENPARVTVINDEPALQIVKADSKMSNGQP
jgi:hypothetical protein